MMLTCRCGVKNYLDPYPFWNFKGRTRCAGCGAIYALELAGGAPVREPQPASDADAGDALLAGSVGEMRDKLGRLRDAGAGMVFIPSMFLPADPRPLLDRFMSEVVPAVR